MDFSQVLSFIFFVVIGWFGFWIYTKKKHVTSSSGEVLPEGEQLPEPPKFCARLKTDIGSDVWAVSEEDHFLRVYGEKGDERILYRFSDAVHDLKDYNGTSVHLQHWVLSDAIDHTEAKGYDFFVVLKNGYKFPVSGTYRRVLEEKGVP